MTSTSLDLSNRPDLGPLSRLAAAVVNAAATLGIPVFMTGAMARDLILAHGYGIDTGRRTEDVDWAMVVEGWAQFDALKHHLLATNRFAASAQVSDGLGSRPDPVWRRGVAARLYRLAARSRHCDAGAWLP